MHIPATSRDVIAGSAAECATMNGELAGNVGAGATAAGNTPATCGSGEVPSISTPVTTLAGIFSLSDLLPELPLPTPLEQTLSSRSLLFHPRVAEEARRLLTIRDGKLVPQLADALANTSAEHIELKEPADLNAAGASRTLSEPELLQALQQLNSQLLSHSAAAAAPVANHVSTAASNSADAVVSTAKGTVPTVPPPAASTAGASRGASTRSTTATQNAVDTRHEPAAAVAPPPPAPPPPTPPADTHTPPGSSNGVLPDAVKREQPPAVSQSQTAPAPATNVSNAVVSAENSVSVSQTPVSAPVAAVSRPEELRETDPVAAAPPVIDGAVIVNNADGATKPPAVENLVKEEAFDRIARSPSGTVINRVGTTPKMKQLSVLLKSNPEDEALMQKCLEDLKRQTSSGDSRPRRSFKLAVESSSDEAEDDGKPGRKFFKTKDKERDATKKKEREERKRKRQDENFDPLKEDGESAAKRIKREEELVERIKTSKRFERRLVPTIEKLSAEELMETNTYQRFNQGLELILDGAEDLDLQAEAADEDADVPQEALIPKYRLQELVSEAAKLKSLGAMESVPAARLVRALAILEINVRDGAQITPLGEAGDGEEESRLWMEIAMERVMRGADASLIIMYILTAPNMPKRVYLEDCIERVMKFMKFQLQNTIYPAFDPVYRAPTKKSGERGGSSKKKRAHARDVRDRNVLSLYNKLRDLVALSAELLHIQVLTDTTVLQVSSLGVAPFFVENISELQLSALKLVTTIFSKYQKHRRLLLDDILASIARLPSSKRSLRTYKLTNVGPGEPDVYIQMLTALVLQLIQCVVVLPNYLGRAKKHSHNEEADGDEPEVEVDRDVLIADRYDTAMRTAHSFLSVFLQKCGSKNEEIDYRPLFENFIQDLLTTVNKPEWPAAECLLSLLGKLLVANFSNKSREMALRVSSLDYLGVVAARLRRDAVTSTARPELIEEIIAEVKREERAAGVTSATTPEEDEKDEKKDKKKKKKKHDTSSESAALEVADPEEERTRFVQRIMLDYLAVSAEREPALLHCRHFYLAQWYKEAPQEILRQRQGPTTPSPVKHRHKKKRKRKSSETSDEDSDSSDAADKDPAVNEELQREVNSLVEGRRQFLLRKVMPFGETTSKLGIRSLQTYLDYDHAELLCRYLASKRPFSRSFDIYLKQIIRVLSESAIAVRTKAMKCLTMVVEADPAVLARTDMQIGVHNSFLDHSTAVREAAVDLVGKFILSRPELIEKYYNMLSARILDTGVSVRKRVIKIMKEICVECPDFPKIPEICVKMIRRVNDEEGIRKLVMEVFQLMWFTPVRLRDRDTSSHHDTNPALLKKVMDITDVVAACRETGLDWFEQLLNTLFKPKEDKEDSTKVVFEPPKSLVTASQQIVDCLVQHILRIEESGLQDKAADTGAAVSRGSSQRLVACLQTLYMFARIRPRLLVSHATTLQPYLSVKCQTKGDYQIIVHVAKTLELVVPLIEHPSDTFLAELEEDSMKSILQHEKTVVASCLACLGSIVNRVTKNFGLIRDCFRKYYGHLKSYRQMHEQMPTNPRLEQYKAYFRRSLFVVGLLLRYFDFNKEDIRKGLNENIVDEVLETYLYFVKQSAWDMQFFTLQSLGFIVIRHYDTMLEDSVKLLYHRLLTEELVNKKLKMQVLLNLETYLVEEERRMVQMDEEWNKRAQEENLKEMGDVTSGMASTIIQLYLKQVMGAFLDSAVTVRHAALKVIQLILGQGLVHPVQIVPYLICMSTDPDERISHTADKQLQEIEKKYPGFIQMKAMAGIRLSFQLQKILQAQEKCTRGLKLREGEPPAALNGFLYSILRMSKQQRRAIAISCLRNFDEQMRKPLDELLYLVDNLAYFPYQVSDEVLFIIHQVDVMVSVTGSTILQMVREALAPPPGVPIRFHPETGAPLPYEEEDEDDDSLFERLPEDLTPIEDALAASEGCNLLLIMKQHLKDFYGITDNKIAQYSPSESGKVYEKGVNRRGNVLFRPDVILRRLEEERSKGEGTDEADKTEEEDAEARKKLIIQYLNFKRLMLHIDPADDDEDDEDRPAGAVGATPSRAAAAAAAAAYPSTPYQSGRSPRGDAAAAAAAAATPVTAQAGPATPVATPAPSEPPPRIVISLGALHKQAAAASERESRRHATASQSQPALPNIPSPAVAEPPRVTKLTIVPLRFPGDEVVRHHKHKHKNKDKHKKKKKKKKVRRESSDDEGGDSDAGSDPDFTV